MPMSPPTVCSTPGCGGRRKNGVCDRCGPKHRRDDRKHAAARGYDYRWQKARLAYLNQNPLCVACSEEDRVGAATVVDHIVPHRGDQALFWDSDNWQGLCEHHHNQKTARGE